MRRASRQLRAYPPSTPSSLIPYMSKTSFGSFDKSVRSGTEDCIYDHRHLVLRDARVDLGIAKTFFSQMIELRHGIQQVAPSFGLDSRRIREIKHGISARAKTHALMLAGQKTAAPQHAKIRLVGFVSAALRNHHDECAGELLVLGANTP